MPRRRCSAPLAAEPVFGRATTEARFQAGSCSAKAFHAGNLKGWMSVRVAHLNWRTPRTSGETAPFNCSRTLRPGSASPVVAGA